jgi:hypothetical protein
MTKQNTDKEQITPNPTNALPPKKKVSRMTLPFLLSVSVHRPVDWALLKLFSQEFPQTLIPIWRLS